MSVKKSTEGKSAPAFLRWPWNVVVYVLLVLALRLFAIPVILLLMGVQRKNNPHGVEEGYCLTRTRKKLFWCLWAVLLILLAAALGVIFYMGLQEDRTYWEIKDYVTLVVSGGGTVFLFLLGIFVGFVGVRDAFFPEKSSLAKSIRNQLPYPDSAPSAAELFAMVDNDLKENGSWFGELGIGREWVLGDSASRIDRIRGIFTVDKIRTRSTQTGTRTSRTLELVLIDDRWEKAITDFRDPKDLQAAAEFLALQVPDAARGKNDQHFDFGNMNQVERENFEREFCRKQSQRASEQAWKAARQDTPQDMILGLDDGSVTSRVTTALVEAHLQNCLDGKERGFVLTPTRPIETEENTFRALRCYRQEGKTGFVLLAAELAASSENGVLSMAHEADRGEAQRIMTGWLNRQAPNTAGWQLGKHAAFPDEKTV